MNIRRSTSLIGMGLATTALATTSLTTTAQAQTNTDVDAVFTGTILDTCTVTVPTPGLLGDSADATVLSSEEAGGQPAQAVLVTNSPRSSVQVLPPDSFTVAPAGSDANTTFATSYDLDGSTVSGLTSTVLGIGVNNLTVNASATKGSGAFEGGAYTLTATVRCITS